MRVKRPRPTRRTPVASGSRVPAWPTRRCAKILRHRATASCEVQPASLSTTTMPMQRPAPAASGAAGIVALGVGVHLPQVAEDLLDPLAMGDSGVGLESEQGRALHPHLPPDGPLQLEIGR